MSLRDQTTVHVMLYEGTGARPLRPETRQAVLSGLLQRGYVVHVTGPAGRPGALLSDGPLLGLAEFDGTQPPRLENLPADRTVRWENIEGLAPEAVLDRVEQARAGWQAAEPGAWLPWFPVIDFDRCTNCMQCLSFCLFGVYGVNAQQQITVESNESCKTNCPACSRVCPEAAIVFPKYKAGPINGDTVNDADLAREKMKVDISALLGGDVYQMLRERNAKARSRFSKERDSDKALQERMRCLKQLADSADIPPEVLMSLPSPEEIQRRAEEAKARAEAALKARR